MSSLQTHAVVLNVRDHGESDKIITLFTQSHGKLTAIAKGAKKSKKRFQNRLELFCLIEALLSTRQRSGMAMLDQAETIARYPNLQNNYARYTGAQLVCELLLLWTREKDADLLLFNNLVWVLDALNKTFAIPDTVILFHTRMLKLLGYQPGLDTCTACGRLEAENAPFFFVPGRNAVVCGKCFHHPNTQRAALSINTIKLLTKAQELPLAKLERLRFSTASVRESLALLHLYGTWLLQREIRSWPFFLAAIGNTGKSTRSS